MTVEPWLTTRAQRAFILTITLQAIVVLTMVIVTFSIVYEYVELRSARFKTLPCYLALFAFAEIFELFMAFDALRLRNIIQLMGLLMFHIALIVAAGLQVSQTRSALVTKGSCTGSMDYVNCGGPGTLWHRVRPFIAVSPGILSISWFFMAYFVRQLYYEFGWAIFHVVGANPKMKTMYQYYQIMICLLKFDFFFFTGLTMQLLIVVLNTSSAEFGISIAAIPIVLSLLILCGIAVQREIKSIMVVSLALMLAALGYFLYKLVRFYLPDSREEYLSTRATLTAFSIVAFFMVLASFAMGVRCFSDFNRGLQHSKTQDGATYSSSGNVSQKHDPAGIPLGRRVTIE